VAGFEVLYKRHKDHLLKLIYQTCFNWSICEDIVQITWEKIIELAKRKAYEPRDSS